MDENTKLTVRGSCGKLHETFKEWQDCNMCLIIDSLNTSQQNKETKAMIDDNLDDTSVGKQEPDPLLAKHETALNVYANEIWNAAIDAAFSMACNYSYEAAKEIGKLKK